MLERFRDAAVMVIDDNEANVALLRAVLERHGLRGIRTYTDPRQAVNELGEVEPDLVLVDLRMPHIDGYGVLARVAAHAGGAYLPALVLTADASATERALRAGARDFLTKPFNTDEVVLRVRNLLETRFLHQELRRNNRWLKARVEGYEFLTRAEQATKDETRSRVQDAIRAGAIRTVYQPVYNLVVNEVVGLEALSRFTVEPARGPHVWFAEAHSVGLGIELERLALGRALAALPALEDGVFLALNTSPGMLLNPALGDTLRPELCPRLVLELTENEPVEDYENLHAALSVFRGHGARLAVDDTGAGYAGFRHLLALRPDIVKLDLSLTHAIDRDPARRALAGALVRFAEDTGCNLIAEGIENERELDTLRELGVPFAQGYYLGRPQPLPDPRRAREN